MKKLFVIVGLLTGVSFYSICRAGAEDLADRLQIGGNAAAAWPLGQQEVKNASNNVGTDFGGLVAYGATSHLSLGLSYDNIDLGHGTRVEPVLFNGIYRPFSDKSWTPNFQLGVGAVKGFSDASYEHFSGKAALGLEFFLCKHLSVGPQVSYLIADDQSISKQYAHVVTAGIFANVFFGGSSEAEPVKQEAAAPPPPPATVAAPMAITLVITNPENTLGPSETVQLVPNETNAHNQNVTWTINPALGSISPTGLYTAPATIALEDTVTVTATSVEDPTKTAVAHVHLMPPATAAKQVSIQMNILFDTNKTDIKPQFDSEIAKVADFMKTYPHCHAEIDGHTDNVGNSKYNLDLSQRRADSVRLEMIAKFNIDGARLTAKGYGEENPAVSNDTAKGRAQNRRVVAVLTAETH